MRSPVESILRFYKEGGNVGTDQGTKAARKLAKDASKELGGGGNACVDQPHNPGELTHAHGLDERGRHLPERGHDFDLNDIVYSLIPPMSPKLEQMIFHHQEWLQGQDIVQNGA